MFVLSLTSELGMREKESETTMQGEAGIVLSNSFF
jgi:hypothetical protein